MIRKTTITGFLTASGCIFCLGSSTFAQTAESVTKAPLQGKVINLEMSNVRDILLDVDRTQNAASHLYDEVSRHPVTTTMRADVIGATVITMPQPSFDMTQVLPARKSWVDTYMGEIKPIVQYMKQDLEAIRSGEADLHLDERDAKSLNPLLAEWAAAIDTSSACTDALIKLTSTGSYDNQAIANQSAELHKAMKAMKKTGKRVVEILKKSDKRKS